MKSGAGVFCASANVTFNAGAITEEGTIEINGALMTVEPGDTVATLMNKFTELCDSANLEYDAATGKISTYEYGITQKIEYKVSDSLQGVFGISNIQPGTDAEAVLGNGFGSTATLTTDGRYVTVKDFGGFEMTVELGESLVADSGQASVEFTQKVTDMGTMTVQLGANEGQVLEVDIPEINAGGVRHSEIARRLRVTGYPEDKITQAEKLEDIMTLIEKQDCDHAYILATYTAMLEFRDILAQRHAVGKEMN